MDLLYESGSNPSIQIFGLTITFYAIFIILGMLAAAVAAYFLLKRRGLPGDIVLDFLIAVIPMSIIGARIYYVIFSDAAYTFWDFFKIWEGGLAVLGGVIGGVCAVLLVSFIKKVNPLDYMDAFAPCLILGQAIGRWGCVFSGCCYGIATEITTFPLALSINGHYHLATNIYESFFNLIGFCALYAFAWYYKGDKPKGIIACAYFGYYGLVRSIIEQFRGDSLFIGDTGIRVSQALSILLLIAAVVCIILSFYLYNRKKKKTALVSDGAAALPKEAVTQEETIKQDNKNEEEK